MRSRGTLAIIALLSTTSCATTASREFSQGHPSAGRTPGGAQVVQHFDDFAVFPAPFAKVWAAVVATTADQGLPVQAIAKDSGILTTSFVTYADGIISGDRGLASISTTRRGFTNIWRSVRYSLSITVAAEGDTATRVRVNPHIEGYDDGLAHRWVVCDSNGALEHRFLEAIRAKL